MSSDSYNRYSNALGSPHRSIPQTRKTPFTRVQHRRVLTAKNAKRRKSVLKRPSLSVDDSLKDFVQKTWHVYSCSPLHNFESNTASFRRMSRLLSSVLAAATSKHRGIATDEEVGTKACFSIANGVAISEDDAPAVKLTVLTPEKKQVAEMFLCSIDCGNLLKDICNLTSKTSQQMKECFTVHPLALCRGNQSTLNVVFNWLKTEFDCSISKVTFNPLSLAWMLGMWSNIPASHKKETATKLMWKIPVANTGLDIIESVAQSDTISILWNACSKTSDDTVLVEEVKNFLYGIQEHLFRHFFIKFHAIPLHQVCLEIVNIHSNGKIKILSLEHVHTILSHLSSLAVEQLNWKVENASETI